MNLGDAFRVLRETEARLLESFEADAGDDLRVLDEACALLMLVLVHVGPRQGTVEVDAETGELSGDVETLKLGAQLYIGIRTLRTIRAGRAVLAFGYEREAPALDRIIVELAAHRREILADDSGEEARAWLARERTRGISARVRRGAPDDLYGNLSQDSHGDPAPVARLLDPESGQVELAPRRGFPTRASLIELYAGMARDQAVVIAKLAGIGLENLDELDSRIIERKTALRKDADAADAAENAGKAPITSEASDDTD